MRCALFGEQVQAYHDVFHTTAKYEISKAPISPVDDQYKINLEELPYQMTIGHQTVVQRLDAEIDPILPKYQPLASIPRAPEPDARYDVAATVLFVEEQARMIPNSWGRESPVCEIVITDSSQDHSVTVSTWNDLTINACNELNNWAATFNIVGFTALKALTARGFTLTTTMSTRIIHEPEGTRVDMLREWIKLYPQVLQDRQASVLNIKYLSAKKTIISIADLRNKKPRNVEQDETFWIKVTIPEPNLSKVYAYVGCVNCGKRTNLRIGTPFPCPSCIKGDSYSTYRLISFREIAALISTKPFFVKVGPTNELSSNNVLIWILKAIEVEDEAAQPTTAHTISVVHSTNEEAATIENLEKVQHELNLEVKAHGKQPLLTDYETTLGFSQDPDAIDDAAFAELVQIEQYTKTANSPEPQQLMFKPLQIKEPETFEPTGSMRMLPTWVQHSRKRSIGKDSTKHSLTLLQN
uniref:Replication factor A C-terminal domain-containing protein n=1 Tax=Chenopodium quinoa TaxID=63459 RepID=A0A803MPJ1_CHEQI